jgi:hypothetical protein
MYQPAPHTGQVGIWWKYMDNQGANISKCDNDNAQVTVLRYKCVKYKFYTATEIMIVIIWKNEKSAQNGIHLLKLKKEIRSKANTMQQHHTTNSIHF